MRESTRRWTIYECVQSGKDVTKELGELTEREQQIYENAKAEYARLRERCGEDVCFVPINDPDFHV